MLKISLCIACAFLQAFAMEFGLGVAGNVGMGFSRWEIDIIDFDANYLSDHLFSREPTYGMGPIMNFWFNRNYGLNVSIQYAWYDYKYTYDYTTSADAVEWKWHYQNLIVPINLLYGIPFGKNRVFIGGGVLLFKQLKGEMSVFAWGENTEVEAVPDDYLETGLLPGFLIGAEFYAGRIGYQASINYHYGLHGVDERFDGSYVSTHHLAVSIGVLYCLGKTNGSDYDFW